jgi:hypothetical protein
MHFLTFYFLFRLSDRRTSLALGVRGRVGRRVRYNTGGVKGLLDGTVTGRATGTVTGWATGTVTGWAIGTVTGWTTGAGVGGVTGWTTGAGVGGVTGLAEGIPTGIRRIVVHTAHVGSLILVQCREESSSVNESSRYGK